MTDVPGLRVGHAQDPEGITGCTVVLCEGGFTAAGDVRGGGPGTRETDLLHPDCLVQEAHAVLLGGGSAFGLTAAEGVMAYLRERGVGIDTHVARVPIVPAAVMFDLPIGRPDAYPTPAMGRRAAEDAATGFDEGSVGAGMGATVGKFAGLDLATKSGVGTASVKAGDLVVGALAAVNATGRWWTKTVACWLAPEAREAGGSTCGKSSGPLRQRQGPSRIPRWPWWEPTPGLPRPRRSEWR